jgi:hypothetical protein
MVITVAIPQTHILHTASFSLTSPTTNTSHSAIATVGQPILTTLRISHTRRWAQPSSLVSAAALSSPTDPIDFVYTIDAHPETWLIAGQRRAHFTATEDEILEWGIMLIPLRPGNVLLPNVEIRPIVGEKKGKEGAQEEILNCETDFLGYGECVVVVPDVRSSTVGVGDMAVAKERGVVWLESAGQV